MRDKDNNKNLKLIVSNNTDTNNNIAKKSSHHTNPLLKKFVEYHENKKEKLKVKDLFGKKKS